MLSQDTLIAENQKEPIKGISPRASPRLHLRVDVGHSNQSFVPDTREAEGTRVPGDMSQNSGRGPAPLPRNSGSPSSSDEDPP